MNRYVYLAGPITGQSYGGASGWRSYAADNLADGIVPLSPMREKGHLANEAEIAASYEDTLFSCARNFSARDEYDVRRSDALLVNFAGAEKVSIGTVLEIGLARGLNKPCVAVIGEADALHAHPMLREFVTSEVATLSDAIKLLNWWLGEGV